MVSCTGFHTPQNVVEGKIQVKGTWADFYSAVAIFLFLINLVVVRYLAIAAAYFRVILLEGFLQCSCNRIFLEANCAFIVIFISACTLPAWGITALILPRERISRYSTSLLAAHASFFILRHRVFKK